MPWCNYFHTQAGSDTLKWIQKYSFLSDIRVITEVVFVSAPLINYFINAICCVCFVQNAVKLTQTGFRTDTISCLLKWKHPKKQTEIHSQIYFVLRIGFYGAFETVERFLTIFPYMISVFPQFYWPLNCVKHKTKWPLSMLTQN